MNTTATTSPRQRTILVVDDTPANLQLLGDHLGKQGFQVLVAQDGEEALTRVAVAKPDLILLDILMPGLGGLETCRRLKADPDHADIPVIFLSALGDTEHRVRAFEAGGVDYITKPFELAEVMARVNAQLSLSEMRHELQAQVAERERAEAALQHANDELEQRVEQRTGELAQAVADLRAEIARRARLEAFRSGQAELLEMIARSAPLTDTLERLTQLIEPELDGMLAAVLLLSEDWWSLRRGAGPSLPDGYLAALDRLPLGPGIGPFGSAIYHRKAVIVGDIAQVDDWPQFRELAAEHGLQTCWSTPILAHDGHVLGSFDLYSRAARRPGTDDQELIAQATRLAGIAIERKQAEQALTASEARFRSLIELSSDEYWEQDEQLRFTHSPLTDNWARSGLVPDDSIGRTRWEQPGIFGVSDEEWAAHRATLEAQQPFRNFEYGRVGAQGKTVYANVSGEPVFDAEGRFHGYRGIAQDITARKQAEAELKRTLLEQQAILDNTVVGIAFVRDEVIQRCNRGFEQLFGWEAGELTGKPIAELYPSSQEYAACSARTQPLIAAGQAVIGDVRFCRKEGRPIWCLYHGKAVAPDDPAQGTVWAMQDITARKQAEHALAEAKSKLEAGMDELEQRNREVSLLGNLSSMLQSCLSPEEAYRAIGNFGARLFPGDAGALFIQTDGHDSLEMVAEWGEPLGLEPVFAPDECWALRRGCAHRVGQHGPAPACAHAKQAVAADRSLLCVPLVAQSETMGMLHLQQHELEHASALEARQRLAIALAEQAALALASIRLRAAVVRQRA